MKIKNKKLFVLFLAAVVAAGIYFAYAHFAPKEEVISYSAFYKLVQEGQVSSAKISSDKIYFSLSGDAAGAKDADVTQKVTANPDSPVLQEFLMRNGVEVSVEKDATEIFSIIFDSIFYIFFFSVFFFVFRKFISPNTFKVVHKTGIKFDDVVGMESLKRDMQIVMEIMKNPAEFAKKGIRMPKGIILEGEPGNGKTLFAKALAGEAKVNFIPAKATDFESMFMAIGPMKVKLLFRKARRRAPCIVFIDEFDGIGTKRNYSGSAIETENTRIVTALLNELDGFEPSQGVLVLAATNSIQALDEALIRPGRFDARFKVPYPDEKARISLSAMYLKGKNPSDECTPENLAKIFDGFSCAKIESALNRASLLSIQEGRTEFTLADVKAASSQI